MKQPKLAAHLSGCGPFSSKPGQAPATAEPGTNRLLSPFHLTHHSFISPAPASLHLCQFLPPPLAPALFVILFCAFFFFLAVPLVNLLNLSGIAHRAKMCHNEIT